MAEATSKHIDGVTDLVVIAPIKPGFIHAFENITFETRLKLVAEALHKIRANAREHELVAPYADTAERILSLFNFRIGVLDPGQFTPAGSSGQAVNPLAPPQRYMFLVATFDGPWEPYMRLIWNPLGPFLDLLLCNCEGYKLATRTGFPEYADWVRRHQVEPSIFYSTTKLTVRDHFYLAQLEKLQREADPAASPQPLDQQLTALTMRDPEDKALAVWKDFRTVPESLRLSFEALAVLYRLADYFPPDRMDGDGAILLKAAQNLLLNLDVRIAEIVALPDAHPAAATLRALLGLMGIIPHPAAPLPQHMLPYHEAYQWFRLSANQPDLPQVEAPPPTDEVQKGLLSGYDDDNWQVTHGLVLLTRIIEPDTAARFLTFHGASWESGSPPATDFDFFGQFRDTSDRRIFRNLAFTASGLEQMGMPTVDLAAFPKEYRDGLFDRAPQLGDVRANHPRRWKLPLRYDRATGTDDRQRPTIHPEEVDVVIQWRLARPANPLIAEPDPDHIDFEAGSIALRGLLQNRSLLATFRANIATFLQPQLSGLAGEAESGQSTQLAKIRELLDAAHPLASFAFVMSEAEGITGLRVSAVEQAFRPLARTADTLPARNNRDHFGFIDGISQPHPVAQPTTSADRYDDTVPVGDIIAGHRNSRGDRQGDHHWNGGADYQANGSFLVIRKIAQFPDRMASFSPAQAEAMVGRTRDGAPLIAGHAPLTNDFLYTGDPAQEQCPFSAHVRLANPRDRFQQRPAPRILRRGMSFGERWNSDDPLSKDKPRGILFMAYAASLAEQYEVVQRWLNGGNATHVSSAANDPLTGPAQEPGQRTFRYRNRDGSVARIRLEQPLTQLLWGIYAFTPSRSALERICAIDRTPLPDPARAQDGDDLLDRVLSYPPEQQRKEWKRLLEDFALKDVSQRDETPRIWQAIRDHHDGVLSVPAGMAYDGGAPDLAEQEAAAQPMVIVASKDAIMDVLSRPADFSVSEQGRRTEASFGAIYVAMDPEPDDFPNNPASRYSRESTRTNEIIFGISDSEQGQRDVFNVTYKIARERLQQAQAFAAAVRQPFYKIELRRDFLAPVMGQLCSVLFDIPDATPRKPDVGHIEEGRWGWDPIDMDGGPVASPGHRKPRCPADFMAPSRTCFYPRPSGAIQEYGIDHGRGLYAASQKLAAGWAQSGTVLKGMVSKPMAAAITDPEMLARNLIGIMEGMLPPLDGTMRGIIFDWADEKSLWRHQSGYLDIRPADGPTLSRTRGALWLAVESAMCKRPAPDLIYRTATRATQINGRDVSAGALVVLALVSPMLDSLDFGTPDIDPVFGGQRQDAWQAEGTPVHACPAYGMVMAMVYGMLAALFDSGRIVVQPASLILRISEWGGVEGLAGSEGDHDMMFATTFDG